MITLPSPNPILNTAQLFYNYSLAGNTISSNITSNTSSTQVNIASLSQTKISSSDYASLGDTLSYTIAITNYGNVPALTVTFSDTIPFITQFLNGSLTLNGTSISGDPQVGISIDSIPAFSTSTISFVVTITTIPTVNPIENTSNTTYSYIVTPGSTPYTGSNSSNISQITISQAIVDSTNGFLKTASPSYGTIGTTITYTLALINTGNVSANNVIFIDTTPDNTVFIDNSLYVDNINQPGGNPNPPSGFNIGTLLPNITRTISFQVLVTTLPTTNTIKNSGFVQYTYTVFPTLPDGEVGTSTSTGTTTTISKAIIDNATGGMSKTSPNEFVTIGDTITYTIVLTNTGNTQATNVVFFDTIPNGTSLISNSVFVNYILNPSGNPNPPTGISIGTINAGSTATVQFSVKVNSIPNPNPIENTASVSFNYTVDPLNPDGATGGGSSNPFTTTISSATIDNTNGNGLNKISNPSYATIGSTITYTISINNTGNVPATNVILKDTIPSGTTFVSNSVILNGSVQSGVNPQSGVTIGTVNPSILQTLTFQVVVNTLPSPNPLNNQAFVTYNYTVYPTLPDGATGGGVTNINATTISQATIDNASGGLIKSSDKTSYVLGETITYTIALKNTGNVNANNVTFIDTLPSIGYFIPNTFKYNNVLISGASPLPPSGVNIGTLSPGISNTITFQVMVTTLPTINPVLNTGSVNFTYQTSPTIPTGTPGVGTSNPLPTSIVGAIINNTITGGVTPGFTKSTSTSFANIGDVITFTSALTNLGNIDANNVVFIDTIPNGTTLIPNSVYLNNIQQPGANPAPPTGINVGTINPNNTSTVVFQVIVLTAPNPNPIVNQAFTAFTYTSSSTIPNNNTSTGISQITTTTVAVASFANVGFTKTSTPGYSNVGSTITYTINLTNLGNTSANNVVFIDTISSATTFIPGSLYYNNIQYPSGDPSVGVNIGSIQPNSFNTVTFQVIVNTIPTTNPITNQGFVNYTYTIFPTIPDGASGSNSSNIAQTTISQAYIDNAHGGLTKTSDKSYYILGETITYTIALINTGNVPANNVVFIDTIPNIGYFIPNSLQYNNVTQTNASPLPPTGFNVGTLNPGVLNTLTFSVFITTLPTINPVVNTGSTSFNYTILPTVPNGGTGTGTSNPLPTSVVGALISNTIVGGANPGFSKSTDRTFAQIGDIITFTATLTNTGNTNANNVVFIDTIPNGTSLVSNSVFVNNVLQPGANPAPPTGISLGTINSGSSSVVSFKVLVNSIPSPNPIVNQAFTTFTFTSDPNNPDGNIGTGTSEITTTTINNANFPNTGSQTSPTNGFLKTSTPPYGNVGTTLTFTISLRNTGSTAATNVVLVDTIPTFTTFIAGSVMFNNLPLSSANPNNGVPLGTLLPNVLNTLTFNVLVTSIPTSNVINNQAVINYSYTAYPTLPNGSNGSNSSNITTNTISQAVIDNNSSGLIKTSDKSSYILGDTITYTISLTNTGNTSANNVVFIDTIPNIGYFVQDSLTFNETVIPGASPLPPTGYTIGTINPGITNTITFKVVITTLPTSNPAVNTGTANYNFTILPTVPNGGTGTGTSNPLPNTIVSPIISGTIVSGINPGFIKSSSTNYADIGTQITFTITLANNGNTPANNVILIDTVPTGTMFISDSVIINGSPVIGVSPNYPGIPLGTINNGSSSVVSFKVVVVTLPSQNPIKNISSTTYTFTSDPSNPDSNTGGGTSTETSTTITNASFISPTGSFIKSVTPQNATIGTTITYTVSYKNGGNSPANNLVFKDTLPSGETFINGSVSLNGTPIPGGNPQTGISLPSAIPSQLNTLTFLVKIVSIPNPTTITNVGIFNYNYTVNPSLPNGAAGNVLTNSISTGINFVDISTVTNGFIKSSDNLYVELGNTITYTIFIQNNGNTPTTSLTVIDTLPSSVSFIANSTQINGVPSGSNPETGINIGVLSPSQISTITFAVLVISVPSTNTIKNSATATYSFVVDPSTGLTTTLTNTSSTSGVTIVSAKVSSTKSMNKIFASIGDTITYTIIYKNEGNVTALNLTLKDTIPNGTSYVLNSLSLNNSPILGDPTTGVNLGSLNSNLVNTVSFMVIVTSLPSSNPITNTAFSSFNYIVSPNLPPSSSFTTATSPSTQINVASFNPDEGGFIKSTEPVSFNIGTTVTYKLTLTNLGNVTAENIFLQDTIAYGILLVNNSLTLNGSPIIGDINLGVTIPNIAANSSVVVTFKGVVTSVPSSYRVSNEANISYNYLVDPSLPNRNSNNTSNEVISVINIASISASKIGNKSSVFIGSSIIYTLLLSNNGNVAADNVFVIDTLPDSMNFVPNSVTVNSSIVNGLSPVTGFTIPNIAPNTTTTITFMAIANSLPRGSVARNTANVSYSYISDPSLPVTTTTISTNSDTVIVAYNINPNKPLPVCLNKKPNTGVLIKQLSVNADTNSCSLNCNSTYRVDGLCYSPEYACISQELPLYRMWQEQNFSSNFTIPNNISEVDSIKASIKIIRNDKIQTPNTNNCSNYEGKVLSGYKEIIEGIITYSITFIDVDGSICTKVFYDLFSSYIVINENYSCSEFDVKGCIEDLAIVSICEDTITFSTTMLLYLTPHNVSCISDTCMCETDLLLTDCISNSKVCSNVITFLTPCDNFWNEFNVFFTENTGVNDIGKLNSISANVTNVNHKLISTPKPYLISNESLSLTGRMLLVTFNINIKINYTTNDGSNVIKRVNMLVPASTYIVVEPVNLCNTQFVISTCIEDVYACNLDGRNLFTNTTLLVKAKLCTPPPCCY
ncbi:MAG: beta strand repeat-containing protein [Clostridium sp.]